MLAVNIFGYLASILIGVSLGLIGGGGSILTVPVLVYMLGINPVLSTAYSLFVVGTTSLIGSFTYMKKQLVDYKAAAVFAVPSFITVFLTRKFIIPAIPDPVLTLDSFTLGRQGAIMGLFALIMLAASYSMLRARKADSAETEDGPLKFNYPLIALEGGAVGMLTGIVGAGGGFLIIPALVLLARLPMKMAVGTSLLIIAAKSLIGFLGDLGHQVIDWQFLTIFTSLSIVGIFLGSYLTRFIPSAKLKGAFGWFVLVMALFILWKEFAA
jgi:uncharacterized membrane protein YfcA